VLACCQGTQPVCDQEAPAAPHAENLKSRRGESGAAPALRETFERREVISAALAAGLLSQNAGSAFAEEAGAADGVLEYKSDKFGFSLSYPSGWKPGNKPVRTHLDEINIKGAGGSELGSFGTAKEVAKKVIGAEKARDGVTGAKAISYGSEEVEGASLQLHARPRLRRTHRRARPPAADRPAAARPRARRLPTAARRGGSQRAIALPEEERRWKCCCIGGSGHVLSVLACPQARRTTPSSMRARRRVATSTSSARSRSRTRSCTCSPRRSMPSSP